MEIRKATAADAANILEYCKIIGSESDNLTFGPEGVSMTVEQEQEYLRSLEDSTTQLYLIALEDHTVVGTASFSCYTKPRLAHRGEISISVRKSMWGNHIGTRLMEEILRFAKQSAHAEILSLEVRSDNTRAISLYQKFGFETVGTFHGFMKIHGAYVDCNIMSKRL